MRDNYIVVDGKFYKEVPHKSAEEWLRDLANNIEHLQEIYEAIEAKRRESGEGGSDAGRI